MAQITIENHDGTVLSSICSNGTYADMLKWGNVKFNNKTLNNATTEQILAEIEVAANSVNQENVGSVISSYFHANKDVIAELIDTNTNTANPSHGTDTDGGNTSLNHSDSFEVITGINMTGGENGQFTYSLVKKTFILPAEYQHPEVSSFWSDYSSQPTTSSRPPQA